MDKEIRKSKGAQIEKILEAMEITFDVTNIILAAFQLECDAPFPGGPLTTRQPAEYSWMSSNPTPLMKIGQSLICTKSSTQGTKPVPTINNDHTGPCVSKNGHLGPCINTHKITSTIYL